MKALGTTPVIEDIMLALCDTGFFGRGSCGTQAALAISPSSRITTVA